jgi:hypothetical protein
MRPHAEAFLLHELGLLDDDNLEILSQAVPYVGESHAYRCGIGVTGIFECQPYAVLKRKPDSLSIAILGKRGRQAEAKKDNIDWSPVHVAKPHKFVKFQLNANCCIWCKLIGDERRKEAGSVVRAFPSRIHRRYFQVKRFIFYIFHNGLNFGLQLISNTKLKHRDAITKKTTVRFP